MTNYYDCIEMDLDKYILESTNLKTFLSLRPKDKENLILYH